MSNASATGPDLPSDGHEAEAPGEGDSRFSERSATGRDSNDELPLAGRLDAGARNPVQGHDQPQAIDSALIAGGEGLVGIANDMTSGPDASAANGGDDPAP